MGYEITFIGLILSLFFIGLTGYYPGGIIVPSYLVLFINQPARIGSTLFIALVTMICYRLISQFVILFGKRRFVFIILLGGLWTFLWLQIFPQLVPDSVEFRVIGWVVPGLIANHFERQGVIVTTASLVTVTVLLFFVGKLFLML